MNGVVATSAASWPAERAARRITIVGGGLAGVLFAIQVLREARAPITLTILEPRERLGAGVAYSSPAPQHVTNVPAARMSADPDDPDAFVRWLAARGETLHGDERDVYPRRWLFGAYVAALFDHACAENPAVRVIHLRQTARRIAGDADGYVVTTADGSIAGDAVVLATGNPIPRLPAALTPVAPSPRCIVDPWRPGALAGIPSDARVLIVGSGLTMGDTVATLRAAGHAGPIVVVSRRGHIPQRGLATPAIPFGDFESRPTTARGLLRLFRREVQRGAEAGVTDHAVLAAARARAWSLWQALRPVEQRRAVRHLRHPYELLRHVMAGPIHDGVTAGMAAGALRLVAARLRDARIVGNAFAIAWQPRGAARDSVVRETFDAVINCTGPSYADLPRIDPLWADLAAHGLIRADTAGLGPAVDREGCALDAAGNPQPNLRLVGTLARSAFGELTGVREIALQARIAARGLQAAAWEAA